MLIALLVVLGIDLIVIVAFVVVVVGRRGWLQRQPGQFVGAVRVTNGALDGIPPRWKRGSARWVRDVLVWSKAPFMLRTQLVAVDRVTAARDAAAGEVKRLRDGGAIATFAAGGATIEVAAGAGHRALLTGPFSAPPSGRGTSPIPPSHPVPGGDDSPRRGRSSALLDDER